MAVRPSTVRARNLRRRATDAEQILWRALREMALPVNVRRQHPIGRYIADFAIPAHKLVIELEHYPTKWNHLTGIILPRG